MDLQRFIELDEKLDEVIRLRGERLAEEIEFANTAESPRSALPVAAGTVGGLLTGIAGTALALRGRRGAGAAKPLTPRQKRSKQNKADHRNNIRRERGKEKFKRSGASMTSQERKDYLAKKLKENKSKPQ